ncbi:MAG: helix-turn-helix transcriptional regulator [Phycisphaerae bacterium]
MTRMKPSEQTRRIIQRSPLTPYRLAKLAGVSEAALSLFLNGKRTITLETLDALAPVLGLTIAGDGRDTKLAESAPLPGRPPAKRTRKAK